MDPAERQPHDLLRPGDQQGGAAPRRRPLWEEYLYSAAGQNAWLKGGAKPVLYDEMDKAGTLDKAAAAALPPVTTPVIPTSEQTDKAKAILAKEWANAIG